MVALKKIAGFFGGMFLVVGKLLYTLVKLVLSLFLLVVQLVLTILHIGSD